MFERKNDLVREERSFEATGVPVIRQGKGRAATPPGISAEGI